MKSQIKYIMNKQKKRFVINVTEKLGFLGFNVVAIIVSVNFIDCQNVNFYKLLILLKNINAHIISFLPGKKKTI